MDHTDTAAETATIPAPSPAPISVLENAASKSALAALEAALSSAAAIGNPAEIAKQTASLAHASVRAAEQMREQLAAMEALRRMTELAGS